MVDKQLAYKVMKHVNKIENNTAIINNIPENVWQTPMALYKTNRQKNGIDIIHDYEKSYYCKAAGIDISLNAELIISAKLSQSSECSTCVLCAEEKKNFINIEKRNCCIYLKEERQKLKRYKSNSLTAYITYILR